MPLRRPTSIARTALPSRVPRARSMCLLSDFFDQLGRAMYGAEWFAGAIDHIPAIGVRPSAGTKEDIACTVQTQILLLFGEGALNALIALHVLQIGQLSQFDAEKFPLDEDPNEGLPKDLLFSVRAEAWGSQSLLRHINWTRSTCSPSFDDLRLQIDGNKYSALECRIATIVEYPIYIENPDLAFRDMFTIGNAPNTLRKALTSRRFARLELIAATWRWISRHEALPSGAQIERYMKAYSASQRFGKFSDQFYRGLAYAILPQVAEAEDYVSVEVTSANVSTNGGQAPVAAD